MTDAITWSAEYGHTHGFDPGRRPPSLAEHLSAYTPDSAARLDEAVKSSLATGEPYEVDLELTRAEGPRWVMARGETTRNAEGRIVGLHGTVQDITDRKFSERELRASQEKFAAAFNASPDLMAVTRTDGTILEVNEAFTSMLGYSPAESIGRTTAELSIWADPGDRERFAATLRAAGKVDDSEARLRCKDGRLRACLGSARTIEVQGEPCILSVVHDITDRKATEEALRASQRRLSAFNRIANVFLTVPDEGTYHWVLTIILELMESPLGLFGFINEDGDLEVPAVATDPSQAGQVAVKSALFPRASWGEIGWARAITERNTITCDGPFKAPNGDLVATGYLAVPIVFGDRSIGLVSVADKPAGYSADDQALLESLAKFVAPVLHARLERSSQERKRASAEAALRESEERYRAHFEHSPAGIYRSTIGGRLLQVNEAFAQLLGYRVAEEMASLSASDLYVDPRGRERFLAELRVDGTIRSLSSELRKKDGSSLWAVESASLVPDASGGLAAIEGTIIDITERKLLEDKMRGLVAAIEQAAETIVITDRDGTIRYANPAFERVTGYSIPEALGQNPRILKSGTHGPEFYRRMWDVLLRGEVWHGHLTNRRKDGTLFEEDATISPVRDESGTVAHFVAVKRDVTQEMALEEQLRHAQKIEAIGRLAGGIAHDFNNLLQVMLSHAQLLRTSPDHFERGLAELEAQIRRGGGLARQLLLFSRREPVRRERLDLNEVIAEAASLLRRLVRENIELLIVPSGHAVKVEADRGQIEQVLMNLVVNAVDAMPDGGRLSIGTGETAEFAWFAVEDSGCGMPQTLRERVFEPFFTTKAPGHGTGLGLSVVHGIVAQHGGHVELDSTEGIGSTFRILLPRTTSGEHEAFTPAHVDDALPEGHGQRVLIVEDEAAARDALQEILGSLGYEVTAVGGGGDAGRLPVESPYDVLLTDLMLPDVNGADLARALRERWPGLRVVLMSGYSEEDSSTSIARLGGAEYLQKPFGTSSLARALNRALAGPAHPDDATAG